MANTKPPRSRNFKAVVEDAKKLVTVLSMEAEAVFGIKAVRVRRIVLFVVVITLLLVLLNWFISPDTAQERQGLAVVFAISLGGVAAIFGLYFTWQTLRTTREHEAARAREAALRACLAQLGNLLTNKDWSIEDNKDKTEDNTLRRLAKAEVLSVLGTLDGPRKRILVRFLYESDLIKKDIPGPEFSLHGADLREADLSRLNLSDSLLSGVRLRGANLSYATLDRANLSGSDFCEEFLRGTTDPDLSRANLEGTSLWRTDLRGVDLRETEKLTQKQIAPAVGDQATKLPGKLRPPEGWRRSAHEQVGEVEV
jgi:uncharacterized protein YjbI with pentapeptide repeats